MANSQSELQVMRHILARLRKDPGLPVKDATISFWQEPKLSFADYQSPNLPREADIVIIGSGITGLSTALHLSRIDSSLRIVILEARAFASGATGRNGGHIKVVPWTDYTELKQYLGKQSAMKITRFRLAHLSALLKEATALGEAGKAGLVREVETLIAYYDRSVWEENKKKLKEFLDDFPEEHGQWIIHEDDADLTSLGLVNACGCISGRAGAAWPYRFLGAIMPKLLESGRVSLETHTAALAVKPTPTSPYPYQVETARGAIQTKHVVHCSNAFAPHLLPGLIGKLFPVRGQMTTQAVPDAFPRVGSTRSWSTVWAQGFDYITQSPGQDGTLYLGGGALQEGLEKDEDIGTTDDSQLSPPCLIHLAGVPAKAFAHGAGSQIIKKWTGIMGYTADGLPIVGRLPRAVSGRDDSMDSRTGGEWVAAGFNGYGMVHSWLSGQALAKMIADNDSEVLDWFPHEEFGCTAKRLNAMNPIASLSHLSGVPMEQLDAQLSGNL